MPLSEAPLTEDLADLYDSAPCGYLSLAPDSRIVKMNQTLAGWLDSQPETLVGQNVHKLLSFGGRIAFETHLAPMLRLQGTVDELALELVQGNGTKVPVIANAAEKRDASGHHLFTRITFFKAVERRAYERGLLDARKEAEEAASLEHEVSVLREQFIAVLGHDLRNPLAALEAGVRMLTDRETLSARGRIILSEMAATVTRSMTLIEEVLDFARGRLGDGLTLSRGDNEFLELILEQVVGEIRAVSPKREIHSRLAFEQRVNCDPGRIAQLTSNLIANAVTHGAEDMPITLEATAKDGIFTLSVINGGAPIPTVAQAQLFQPFFRGTVRRSQNGLGLGLFIVNEIAKAHGGEMDVKSSDDETRFTFSMPLQAKSD